MNHLISYSDAVHPLYFLTRFVEGLRADIRAVVMVQRPKDLDTACALVVLQEEVAEGHKGPWYSQPEGSGLPSRARQSTPLPLPPPPVRAPAAHPAAEDRRGRMQLEPTMMCRNSLPCATFAVPRGSVSSVGNGGDMIMCVLPPSSCM